MPTGLAGGSSASVIKSGLDEVVMAAYTRTPNPETGTAESPELFRQVVVDRGAEVTEQYSGVPKFEERAEQAVITAQSPRVGNSKTFTVKNLSSQVNISKNLFDDEKYGVVQMMMEDFGNKARTSMDNEAMGIYRGAFTTTLTNDGSALCADAHTTLNGDTVDNLLAASALSESTLNTGFTALTEQLDQSGTIVGHMPYCLLVPQALYKTAVEITDSELRSGTGNNDINMYSSKYGIIVKTSPHLGAAAGGSDTAYFILSQNHLVTRYKRNELETALVDWVYQANNDYIYKGEFREVYGAISYEGVVGSAGA